MSFPAHRAGISRTDAAIVRAATRLAEMGDDVSGHGDVSDYAKAPGAVNKDWTATEAKQDAAGRWARRATVAFCMLAAVGRGSSHDKAQIGDALAAAEKNISAALRTLGLKADFSVVGDLSVDIAGMSSEEVRSALVNLGRKIMSGSGNAVDDSLINAVMRTQFAKLLSVHESLLRATARNAPHVVTKRPLSQDAKDIVDRCWVDDDDVAERFASTQAAIEEEFGHLRMLEKHLKGLSLAVMSVKNERNPSSRGEHLGTLKIVIGRSAVMAGSAIPNGGNSLTEIKAMQILGSHLSAEDVLQRILNLKACSDDPEIKRYLNALLFGLDHSSYSAMSSSGRTGTADFGVVVYGALYEALPSGGIFLDQDVDAASERVQKRLEDMNVGEEIVARREKLRSDWLALCDEMAEHSGRGHNSIDGARKLSDNVHALDENLEREAMVGRISSATAVAEKKSQVFEADWQGNAEATFKDGDNL